MARSFYLHVTLKIRQPHVELFYETMEKAVPIIESLGWKFIGAWADRVGRLNTVIDFWELEDPNDYWRVMSEFAKHPDYPEIKKGMDIAIEEEVVHMMDKVPYGRL